MAGPETTAVESTAPESTAPDSTAPESTAPDSTAPEPTAARRARPLTDYWDHRMASWRAAPAIPAPRRGD